ncbi:MAG: site-specific integrase [Brevundimonas sp.]|nr:MAG: site-specific integrase [Brevundimonas sp.]
MTLTGLHRIRRSAGGRFYEYWYAWRGGPQILKASGATEKALEREIGKLSPAALDAYREKTRRGSDSVTIFGLITRYLDHMADNQNLADRTKKDRRKHLDTAREEIGHIEVKALESRKMRPYLIGWRDKRAKTPKTADDLLSDLSAVFNWAVDNGEIARNPVAGFPRIYQVNRAEVIWEPLALLTFLSFADPEVAWAVRLAAATGIRKEDLIKLPWTAVKDNTLAFQTGKSRKRRTAVIALTDELRAVLADIPRRGVTVLTSSDGLPWKPPGNGLDSGVRRARMAALAHVQKTAGQGALSGLEGLRFHDLRGTAATHRVLAGIDPLDVATELGWEVERVNEIIRRYVSDEAMAKGLILRTYQGKTIFTQAH